LYRDPPCIPSQTAVPTTEHPPTWISKI
jgi:hypothetical protein